MSYSMLSTPFDPAEEPLTLPASAEYHCAIMILCTSVDQPNGPNVANAFQMETVEEFSSEQSSEEPLVSELIDKRDLHALQAAVLLRDFRETYGLKITLPSVFQAQAAASFYLLLRLDTATGQAPPVFLRQDDSVRDDVSAAFEESSRCLLGASTHMMMARGVLRMLIQTAIHLKITLPPAVIAAIQTVQVWHSRNVEQISSIYPNYAIAHGAKSRADAQMETLLRKWEQTAMGM